MSINKMIKNIIRTIGTTIQQVVQYVFSAAIRTFSPSDNDYPASGVQPFEGDPADKKSH